MDHRVVNEYNAMKLNCYNGTYEIVSGNAKDDKFYPEWAIVSRYDSDMGHGMPAKKDDGSYRVLPVKVVLGARAKAIENLEWLLGQLKEPTPDDTPPGDTLDGDVPF
jgi:hypothetical protein